MALSIVVPIKEKKRKKGKEKKKKKKEKKKKEKEKNINSKVEEYGPYRVQDTFPLTTLSVLYNV